MHEGVLTWVHFLTVGVLSRGRRGLRAFCILE